jgi:hypothetical protein
MRNSWKKSTNDERLDRRHSLAAAGRRSRDLSGREEEKVSSSETGGKSISGLRGLSTPEESSNGGLVLRLDGGGASRCWEKRGEKWLSISA